MSTTAADNLWIRLKELNSIGIALSKEQSTTRLLETILVAAKNITNADGGTIYLMQGEGKERILKFEIIRTDSLHLVMGGTTGAPIPFYPVKLIGERTGSLITPW